MNYFHSIPPQAESNEIAFFDNEFFGEDASCIHSNYDFFWINDEYRKRKRNASPVSYNASALGIGQRVFSAARCREFGQAHPKSLHLPFECRNALDLDQCAKRQLRDLHSGAGWLVAAEVL